MVEQAMIILLCVHPEYDGWVKKAILRPGEVTGKQYSCRFIGE